MGDRYTDFFLNSRADVIRFELLEITHPAFTRAYRIVKNARDGLVVDLPLDGAIAAVPGAVFDYYPAAITSLSSSDDLEASIRVSLGDLGEVLPMEIDAVAAAGAFLTKPAVRYWVYRSDDLTLPVFGPIHLETSHISSDADGANFDAAAPSLNRNRTGELYRLEVFPMLRGTL